MGRRTAVWAFIHGFFSTQLCFASADFTSLSLTSCSVALLPQLLFPPVLVTAPSPVHPSGLWADAASHGATPSAPYHHSLVPRTHLDLCKYLLLKPTFKLILNCAKIRVT